MYLSISEEELLMENKRIRVVYEKECFNEISRVETNSVDFVLINAKKRKMLGQSLLEELERVVRLEGFVFFYNEEDLLEDLILHATEEDETVLTMFEDDLNVAGICFKNNRNCVIIEPNFNKFVGTRDKLKAILKGKDSFVIKTGKEPLKLF